MKCHCCVDNATLYQRGVSSPWTNTSYGSLFVNVCCVRKGNLNPHSLSTCLLPCQTKTTRPGRRHLGWRGSISRWRLGGGGGPIFLHEGGVFLIPMPKLATAPHFHFFCVVDLKLFCFADSLVVWLWVQIPCYQLCLLG